VEIDLRPAQSDRKLEELDRKPVEPDRKLEELDRKLAEPDRKLEVLDQKPGGIGSRSGVSGWKFVVPEALVHLGSRPVVID